MSIYRLNRRNKRRTQYMVIETKAARFKIKEISSLPDYCQIIHIYWRDAAVNSLLFSQITF